MMMTCEGTADAKRWGGEDDSVNNNKARVKILRIPPFVHSLRCYLRGQKDRDWNCNQNWNQWNMRNTKRGARSTARAEA